jgi:hypothetical protein
MTDGNTNKGVVLGQCLDTSDVKVKFSAAALPLWMVKLKGISTHAVAFAVSVTLPAHVNWAGVYSAQEPRAGEKVKRFGVIAVPGGAVARTVTLALLSSHGTLNWK